MSGYGRGPWVWRPKSSTSRATDYTGSVSSHAPWRRFTPGVAVPPAPSVEGAFGHGKSGALRGKVMSKAIKSWHNSVRKRLNEFLKLNGGWQHGYIQGFISTDVSYDVYLKRHDKVKRKREEDKHNPILTIPSEEFVRAQIAIQRIANLAVRHGLEFDSVNCFQKGFNSGTVLGLGSGLGLSAPVFGLLTATGFVTAGLAGTAGAGVTVAAAGSLGSSAAIAFDGLLDESISAFSTLSLPLPLPASLPPPP